VNCATFSSPDIISMDDSSLAEHAPQADTVATHRRALEQLDAGVSSALSTIHRLDALAQEPNPDGIVLREGMCVCTAAPRTLPAQRLTGVLAPHLVQLAAHGPGRADAAGGVPGRPEAPDAAGRGVCGRRAQPGRLHRRLHAALARDRGGGQGEEECDRQSLQQSTGAGQRAGWVALEQ